MTPQLESADQYHKRRITEGQACLAAALDYLRHSWAPLPLCPPDHVGVGKGHKECNSPGKRPWISWKKFEDSLPTEPEVRGWWGNNPQSNVGIALGPVSGLVGIDIDGAGGEKLLAEQSHGNLPATLEFTTPGGGRRLLYRIPPGAVLRTTSHRGGGERQELRFQSRGAQTVMPPSIHPNGGQYAWRPGRGPGEIEPALAPDWLLDELRDKPPLAVVCPVAANGQPAADKVIGRARAYISKMPPAISGQGGHNQTFSVACKLVEGFNLSPDEAFPLIQEYNGRCLPSWSDQELQHKLADADKQAGCNGKPRGYLLREIIVSTEEYKTNDQAIDALANDPVIYQRGGSLVRVVCDESPATKGIRRALTPRIDLVPVAVLRGRLTEIARFVSWKQVGGKWVTQPTHPPGWCIAYIHALGQWPGIRHLEAVVEYPVLKPDGTILGTPGYDAETGLLLDAKELPVIPDRPTKDQAIAARDSLLEVFADFPFERPEHRSACLAALLTPLARFAIPGPTPLFLVDANVRAAGKGLLLNCISRIVTGERSTVATYTADDDELRKRITSLALAGDRMVLFDNLAGDFGSPVLDAALTTTSWKDRILGTNRTAEVALFMTWFATGNNVSIAGDTARRCCHVRLESPCERPEERQGFKHPDLLAWVSKNRLRLLADALTILRGYCVAGKPDQRLTPWGSFEEWSRLVRSAVVWVDMEDPGKTRAQLQERADSSSGNMATILEYLDRLDLDRQGMTAAEIIERAYQAGKEELKEAIEGLTGKLDTKLLGCKLRGYRRRVFCGRFLDYSTVVHKTARWRVYPAADFRLVG
jgi:hypothetical protein